MAAKDRKRALVLYPDTQSYTTQAVVKAFREVLPEWDVDTSRSSNLLYDLQFADYDAIDWDAADDPKTFVNSYMLRKALIRKNYLATAVAHRLAKHPDSVLKTSIPKSYAFEIAHADELDELFYDELYDVSESLDNDNGEKWWILKPAMADKGQGIRIFNTKEALQNIFDSFEDDDSDEDEEEDEDEDAGEEKSDMQEDPTKVSLSTMRDWVIQEYLSKPLLFDTQGLQGAENSQRGKKFHLRVYVLAIGALEVYVYTDMLALFAGSDFEELSSNPNAVEDGVQDLTAHLTNTCLQDDETAKQSVYLLSDLIGKRFLSATHHMTESTLTQDQADSIIRRIGQVIGETFRAGLGMANHFSTAPNAFEVFGIDVLLSEPEDGTTEIPVHLLEVNACPDYRQTGDDRHYVIEELFAGVLDLAVKPYFDSASSRKDWKVGQQRGKWLKSLDIAEGS